MLRKLALVRTEHLEIGRRGEDLRDRLDIVEAEFGDAVERCGGRPG
jgi:hypothetical protein